jgi:transposase-like protein
MFNNLRELIATMPDETTCRNYLIQQRWNGNVTCPYCGFSKVYVIENGKRFKCADRYNCAKKFTCTIGTIMEASNIPIYKWLTAIYICSAHKKGISSYQLAKDIGISQKSSWFMLHRIRQAFGSGNDELVLDVQVQADEAFIVGSDKFRHKDKKSVDADGKAVKSNAPVMGMIETGGKVKTKAVN